jgi:hypothetical protein
VSTDFYVGRSLQPATEHVGPELHELRFVETSISVLVEHLYESHRSLFVDSHHVLYDLYDLLRTQYAIVILVEFAEAFRYLFVAVKPSQIKVTSEVGYS